MKNRYINLICSCGVLLAFSGATQAASIEGDSNGVSITDEPSSAISLTVRGPSGFLLETESFYVDSDTGLVDGKYSYDILGELEVVAPIISDGSDGRGAGTAPTQTPVGIIESGSFLLSDGKLLEETGE